MKKIIMIFALLSIFLVDSVLSAASSPFVNDYFYGKCSRGLAVVSLPYRGEDATKPRFENGYTLATQLIYKCDRVECAKSITTHTLSDLYGIIVYKYNDPEKVVWATNFEWVAEADGFYEFFEGSRVEPWGPTRGYEKIFRAIEKIFSGPLSYKEAIEIFKEAREGG
jgi:hypothetical protein